MFKQYMKHKNITVILTDCNIRTNTDSSYSKKITRRSSIGPEPTDTILIRNLKRIEIYLHGYVTLGDASVVIIQQAGGAPSKIKDGR